MSWPSLAGYNTSRYTLRCKKFGAARRLLSFPDTRITIKYVVNMESDGLVFVNFRVSFCNFCFCFFFNRFNFQMSNDKVSIYFYVNTQRERIGCWNDYANSNGNIEVNKTYFNATKTCWLPHLLIYCVYSYCELVNLKW